MSDEPEPPVVPAFEVAGAHAVVTGGAGGIGAALVAGLVERGAGVVSVCDLDGEGAARSAQAGGGLGAAVDVAAAGALEGFLSDATEAHGPIDLLCSNAGIGAVSSWDTPEEEWGREWEIHVLAHLRGARAVLPGMLARRRGHLLSTVSAAGLIGMPGGAAYSATKSAALALAEHLAARHGSDGIGVTALCPQGVSTAMTEDEAVAAVVGADGMISAETCAGAALEAVRTGRFLCLPHPEVARYAAWRAADPERWIRATSGPTREAAARG